VVERDRRLAGHLRATFGKRVQIVEGDALSVELPPVRVVVGNLPFSVATPLLVRLWQRRTPRIVALVQREVADRLAAGPGSKVYGRLSIVAALYGSVELFQPVPATDFHPVPEVEGRIVLLTARAEALPVPSVPAFETLLHGLFSARRKQLANLLPRVAPAGSDLGALAEEADWPADWRRRRPETLAPEAFFRMSTAVERTRGRRRSTSDR
jgi:16S rRNA (adenine1518-N6/adenine1519-N6)-dimethyltransferase